MHGRRKMWILAAFLLLAALVAYVPIADSILAIRLTLALRSLAAGATGQDLPVVETKVRKLHGARTLEALAYRPAQTLPERAVVLVAGISELGCYHPRLMALSRLMANLGFLVLTPDIEMFRRFKLAPEAMEQIAFWYSQMPELEGGRKLRRIGLAGISYSGTLALITAVRPEIRDSAAFVLAIGPYNDPLQCSQTWFAPGPVTVGEGYYPTRFYAKWITMLAALAMLPDEQERQFLSEVLVDLLLQKEVPAERPNLSEEAGRWYRLALMRENQSDQELAQRIEEHLTPLLYRHITPDRAAAEVRCPVFLFHGAYDDLIPPEESRRLQQRIGRERAYLLISPFITHTHPLAKPLSRAQQIKAGLEVFGFFYRFASVVR